MQPNFMLIGAAKCATTSICNTITRHPEVHVTPVKEPYFFANDEIFAQGVDWYESLFDEEPDKPMRGEGSNRYTMREVFPHAADRIHAYNPDLKLVYVVRDPLPRIVSYWIEKRSHLGDSVHWDFNTAVRENRDWLVDSSRYWHQLQPYLERFGGERVRVMFFEDYKRDQAAFLRQMFEFLGVDPMWEPPGETRHVNPSEGKLVPKPALSKLRSFGLWRAARRLVPRSIIRPIKRRLFLETLDEKPRWNSDTRRWVLEDVGIAEDARHLLSHCGRAETMWTLT